MKFLLVALALIAVVRPEHFIPVAVTGALAVGVLLGLARLLHGEPLFDDGGSAAAKVLLVVMTAIAVIRPEHFITVVAIGAAVLALLLVVRQAVRAVRGDGESRLATNGPDAEGKAPGD
jgi:MFS superfamily sulfate permease-like transporter